MEAGTRRKILHENVRLRFDNRVLKERLGHAHEALIFAWAWFGVSTVTAVAVYVFRGSFQ